ncbi:MAG: hypothetical protein ACLGI6_05720, partial [Gammaproteobacteria bacterium]
MKRFALSSEQLAGLAVALLGLVITLRWVFLSTTITLLIPGSAQMGINSPVLFMAAGFCCIFALHPGGKLRQHLWKGCAALLLVLPTLVLIEHLFNISLGIDFVRVPTAPTPATPHPGRMSPNATLAFLLAGVAFQLIRRPIRSPLQEQVLAACAALVAGIGMFALLGYFLNLEALYRVAALNVMVPPTAAGMSVLGIGLWMLRATLRERRGVPVDYERRITWRAIGVVTLVAVSAGAAGFAAMRESYEQSIADNTLASATTSASAIGTTLETSLWFARNLATRSAVRERLLALERDPDDAAERVRLTSIGASFFNAGVTAVQFYNVNDQLMAAAGTLARGDAVSRQPLASGGQRAELLWKGGYLLYTESEVRQDGRVLGRVVAEQRLPTLDHLLENVRARSP